MTTLGSPSFHTFDLEGRKYILEVATGDILDAALDNELVELQLPEQEPGPPSRVPIRSLSLAIAQKCNLGCAYCYAQQGTFGGRASNMPISVAKASVDRLLSDAPADQEIVVGFMGGEPLFNRDVLYATTEYAAEKARQTGQSLLFAITTNATLVRPEDVDLFQMYRFAVTVSVDGLGRPNDALRPFISGKGSFDTVREKLKLMLGYPDRQFQLYARATVTPKNLKLTQTFQGLLNLGFDSIRFSPMLSSPNGEHEMSGDDLDVMLEQMIHCGEFFREGFKKKKLYPFENVLGLLKRIHHYQMEPYPCGAGGGYMGVSAEGDLYACHRFVNDENGHMGSVFSGVSPERQAAWLSSRHLRAQLGCNSCWARYLCSGSCHHEVLTRGRPACDYIRGWLHYCFSLYIDLVESDPKAINLLLGERANISRNGIRTSLANGV